MEYVVEIKPVPTQLIAATRQRLTHRQVSQQIRELLARVWAFLNEQPRLRTEGHNVQFTGTSRSKLSA